MKRIASWSIWELYVWKESRSPRGAIQYGTWHPHGGISCRQAARLGLALRRAGARSGRQAAANDKIQFATIGCGIMGQGDTETAMSVPGVNWSRCATFTKAA